MPAPASLIVSEIFSSIQGETTEAGRPCTFVRLTACDLRCTWCDTEHAFTGGTRRSLDDVVAEVMRRGLPFVTVTGGEPLAQPAAPGLVTALLDEGCEVQVETGGHRDVTVLDRRARIILDLKPPASGETHRMRWENVAALTERDQVKFVVAGRGDYEWARDVHRRALASFRGPVLYQPARPVQDPAELAGWILEDRLPARLSLQLHQILWPGRTGV